jgi:hypothetical protein
MQWPPPRPGGAGIEDHFNDGRFHDLMVRVTGDVVRQAQAALLTSSRAHGGRLPADCWGISPCRPTGLDSDRPGPGGPGRVRRRHAGRPGADRRGARAPRRDEPVLHAPRHHRATARGRAAWREGPGRRRRALEQPRGDRGGEASLCGSRRRRRRGLGAAGHHRPYQGRHRRRRRQLRHAQPRRLGALPELGARDDRREREGALLSVVSRSSSRTRDRRCPPRC